jgi:dTDP-4-dehydrorhamnose reductase
MFVLVTGSNGQLGRSLNHLVDQNKTDYRFVFATREQLDLTDFQNIRSFIEKNQFDVIINCAAYTAVDKSEVEKEQANLVNHLSVKNIAEIARDNCIKLIHISTDYVFDGLKFKPYIEKDNTSPKNVYGKTKLDGENAILSTMACDALIIRTSWLYSEYGNNFLDTILKLTQTKEKLNIVSDQIGSPTYANDLAIAILTIIESSKFSKASEISEVFHYSNGGKCSWYDFAREIVQITGKKCSIDPIFSKDYPQSATRPKHVLLDKDKIRNSFGLNIIFWKDSLNKCIQALSNSSNTN